MNSETNFELNTFCREKPFIFLFFFSCLEDFVHLFPFFFLVETL